MAELKTAVFLFTDIEKSTRLWEAEESAMQSALVRHDALLRDAIGRHEGRVFTTAGDSFAASFSSVRAALDAALEAQLALTAERWAIDGVLRVRMGLHLGEAQSRDGDWFGSTVNRTARIMSVAHGGQVVASSAVIEARGLLPGEARLTDLGWHGLKDLSGEEHLWQVAAPGLPDEFPLRFARSER